MTVRRGRDAGVFVVEFTALTPLLALVFLVVWEAFLFGMTAVHASHAANEGARAAAVSGDCRVITREALRRVTGIWADEDHVRVHCPAGPGDGYVSVDMKVPFMFPKVSSGFTVSSRAKVVRESGR